MAIHFLYKSVLLGYNHSEVIFVKRIILFICIAFVFVLMLLQSGEAEELRLRVIANSDGISDQSVKMQVVDAVDRMLDRECFKTLESAEAWITDNTDRIKTACADTLGNDDFSVELCDEEFSDGVYKSLVITLGEGRGHNFWGTLFPSISEKISAVKGDGKALCTVSKNGRLTELRLWLLRLVDN